ncbi:hypothetical protein Clacol_008506 [Clathrus columnatus]|uniref:Cytochrome P450 n=1 Tax=Clathrus columnatus TaxID=1419009 RepID=A0AAV5AKH6_9AGAM|nr:hypothetical protein Clacol_008506 [Clathrus columnatus]
MALSKPFLSILLSLLIAIYFKRRSSKRADNDPNLASVEDLKGPPRSSWLAGNLPDFVYTKNVGNEDNGLIRQFGLACRMKVTFNTDALFLADPKGLQHVLNTSGYNFHKRDAAKLTHIMLGAKNILAVEGEEHARQRRMLTPSFSQSYLHEIVPEFTHTTSKLVELWNDLVATKQGAGIDIDLHMWLSRLTLDALGQGVLSYDFKALTDEPSEYVAAFRGLFVDMFSQRTNAQLAIGDLMGKLPSFISRGLLNSSLSAMNRFQEFVSISSKISSSIMVREKEAARLGQELKSKDLLSTLSRPRFWCRFNNPLTDHRSLSVRANLSENPRSRLTDEEVLSQMIAFTIAGHDTVSSMLQWVFYELSLHPEAQAKIRKEIKLIKDVKGVQVLGPSEFESMHYTMAVLKETLRFHPVAPHNVRRADRDDVIPLAYPLKTASGKEVHSIHVKKGQTVFMSQYGYNQIEDLWGRDTDKWIPERFLNEKESERSKRTIGVFAHLATFSSGVHACIGWRFALLEMQAILIGLLEHFEFAPASSKPIILRKLSSTMYASTVIRKNRLDKYKKGHHRARPEDSDIT